MDKNSENQNIQQEYRDNIINRYGTEANQGQVALDELATILAAMGIKAQVFYQERDDEIHLEVKGPNLGLVIGKRGQTLEALEFILNLIHKKHFANPKELIIDVEGYREKKIDILKKIVSNARETVLSTHHEVPLEPMTPSDRKIIHLMCRELGDIISESRGEGQRRRVVIKPNDDKINYEKKDTIH